MGRPLLLAAGYAATAAVLWAFLTLHQGPAPGAQWLRWAILVLLAPSLLRYAIQLLVAPFYEVVMARRRHRRNKAARRLVEQPIVSVLVPAWNEEVGIASTVRSILDSHYPQVEVIAIDDGSTDDTLQVLKRLAERHNRPDDDHRLVVLTQENAGKARALNYALRAARGDIIVTIDADSVVDPEAIGALVELFDDPHVKSVAGNVKIGNRQGALGLVQQMEYLYAFFFKKADSLLGAVYIVGGAAAAYRRDVFEELGGFDETIITEDIELSTRIQDAGHIVQYAPDAVVWTEGAATLTSIARQRLRWKYGRLVTFWRYRRMFFSMAPHHNQILTWLMMPVALLGDLLLLLEPLILTIVFSYTFISRDFLPMVIYIAILAIILTYQVLTDVRRRDNLNLLALAPCVWVVVYIIDLIELQALVRSLYRLGARRELTWQRWERVGVFSGPGARGSRAVASSEAPTKLGP